MKIICRCLYKLIIEKGKEQLHENVLVPCDAIVTDKGLDVLTINHLYSNYVASHLSSNYVANLGTS